MPVIWHYLAVVTGIATIIAKQSVVIYMVINFVETKVNFGGNMRGFTVPFVIVVKLFNFCITGTGSVYPSWVRGTSPARCPMLS